MTRDQATKLFRAAPLSLALILIIAFFTRLKYALSLGTLVYSGDEIAYMDASFRIVFRALDYGVFYHGPLYFYMESFLFSCLFSAGKILGWFKDSIDFIVFYLENAGVFYSIGRITAAVFNVATIYLIFRLGTYLWNKKTGLLAALAYALIPMAFLIGTQASMYATTDFFIVLSAFYGLRLIKKSELRDIIKAGVAFGLALSADYYALLLVPLYITVFSHLDHGKQKTVALSRALLVFLALSLSIFIVANPLFILRPGIAWQGISDQIHAAFYSEWGRPHDLLYYARCLSTPPYFFLSVFFAVGACLAIKKRRPREIAIALFPLLNILLFSFSKVQLDLYLVHALPFIVLTGSRAATMVFRLRKLNLFTLLLIFFVHAFFCMQGRAPRFYNESASIAKEWFQKYVPRGSAVLINPGVIPFGQSRLSQIVQDEKLYASVLERYLQKHPEENYEFWTWNLLKESIRLIEDKKIRYLILPERDYDQEGKAWLSQNALLLKAFGKRKNGTWRIRIYEVIKRAGL